MAGLVTQKYTGLLWIGNYLDFWGPLIHYSPIQWFITFLINYYLFRFAFTLLLLSLFPTLSLLPKLSLLRGPMLLLMCFLFFLSCRCRQRFLHIFGHIGSNQVGTSPHTRLAGSRLRIGRVVQCHANNCFDEMELNGKWIAEHFRRAELRVEVGWNECDWSSAREWDLYFYPFPPVLCYKTRARACGEGRSGVDVTRVQNSGGAARDKSCDIPSSGHQHEAV